MVRGLDRARFDADQLRQELRAAGMDKREREVTIDRCLEGVVLTLPLPVARARELGLRASSIAEGKGLATPNGNARGGCRFTLVAARCPEQVDTRHDCGHLHPRLADAARCARRIRGQVYRIRYEGLGDTRTRYVELVPDWEQAPDPFALSG